MLIAFMLGAVAALRMPVPVFSLLAFIAVAGIFIAQMTAGRTWGDAALWCVVYGAILQAGYVLAHLGMYLHQLRLRIRERNAASGIGRELEADHRSSKRSEQQP